MTGSHLRTIASPVSTLGSTLDIACYQRHSVYYANRPVTIAGAGTTSALRMPTIAAIQRARTLRSRSASVRHCRTCAPQLRSVSRQPTGQTRVPPVPRVKETSLRSRSVAVSARVASIK